MASTTAGPPKPPPRFGRQDVPPAGGYAPINVDRNVPKSVTRGGALALFVGGGLTIAWGLYKVGTFNVHRRMLKQEKKDIRLAIMPLLQAEEDARFAKERKKYVAWESELMKDVPGFQNDPNVYKTRTFMAPFMSTSGYER